MDNKGDVNSAFKELFYYCKLVLQEKKEKEEELEKVKRKLNAEIEKCHQYKNEIIESSVEERWKIGEYLHDTLAQSLVSAKILVNQIKYKLSDYEIGISEEIEELESIISAGIYETRNLSHEIIPVDIEKEGMFHAFRLLEMQTRQRLGINCTLETDEIIHKISSREVATNLYHIAQEAIKNAITHGEAGHVKIAIREQNRQIHLHIKDDGKGFDSADQYSGMGINIMRHRAEEMGGTLGIGKTEGAGEFRTCVTCTLPVEILTSGD